MGWWWEALLVSFGHAVRQDRVATRSACGQRSQGTKAWPQGATWVPRGPVSRLPLKGALMRARRVIKHSVSAWVASWTRLDTLINLEKCPHFHLMRKVWKSPVPCVCVAASRSCQLAVFIH